MAVFIVGFFDVLRAGFAERRTTAGLNGELVAKAPGLQKYCVREEEGRGFFMVPKLGCPSCDAYV